MDGQEALELLQDEADLPDVILLDVMMPGMSGYEVGDYEEEEGVMMEEDERGTRPPCCMFAGASAGAAASGYCGQWTQSDAPESCPR